MPTRRSRQRKRNLTCGDAAATDGLCGIGITFVEGQDGELVVRKVMPGGAADYDGKARVSGPLLLLLLDGGIMPLKVLRSQEGDVLWQVDDQDAFFKEPQDIGRMLVGKEGTQVPFPPSSFTTSSFVPTAPFQMQNDFAWIDGFFSDGLPRPMHAGCSHVSTWKLEENDRGAPYAHGSH